MIDLKIIGRNCKAFRVESGRTLADVAKDTGYSIENVSAFEHGRINNGYLIMYHLHNGMDLNALFWGTEWEVTG